MLRLRDIMTADVVAVPPELTIRDALVLFSKRHVSGAPVVSGRHVVGVVSLTDLAEVAEMPSPDSNPLDDRTVGEVMNRQVFSLPPDTFVDKAADVMRTADMHRVLVMDGDALIGLVTTRDLANAVADHQLTTRRYVFDRKAERDERGWT
jgi:CBS domain-containing protein